MKKLLFLLPVLLLAVSLLQAQARIATVGSFSGDIILVHNGVRSWVSVGVQVYAGDQICVRASGGGANDWIKLDDQLVPGSCTISQPQVAGFPEGRWWNAMTQQFTDPEGGGTTSAIVIPQPDRYFMLPHLVSPD